jgi:hypothetical protein
MTAFLLFAALSYLTFRFVVYPMADAIGREIALIGHSFDRR